MEDLLRRKGIYRIIIGIKTSTNDEENIVKWDNKNDKAHGLIGMSISPNLIVHLDGLDSPVKAWNK